MSKYIIHLFMFFSFIVENSDGNYEKNTSFSNDRGPILTTSSRGVRKMCESGYKLLRQRTIGLRSRWRCRNHFRSCNASIHTVHDKEIIKINTNHNHSTVAKTENRFLDAVKKILRKQHRDYINPILNKLILSKMGFDHQLAGDHGESSTVPWPHAAVMGGTRWWIEHTPPRRDRGKVLGGLEIPEPSDMYEIGHRGGCNRGPIFTISSRGARIISVTGYKFTRHRVLGSKTRWHCGSHRKQGCRAVIFTRDDDKIVTCDNDHNHPPPMKL